ncbi:MAG: glycosyltransferase family 4 protein [Cyanobacteria bacterium REEB459]|nr:glycosyltransferase family 4 protein [Cyanobacteria bacterium REEB459]
MDIDILPTPVTEIVADQPLRVLMLAETCNPSWPSLPLLAYRLARELSTQVELVVATQIRNRPAIEQEGLGRAEVLYFDTENIAAPLTRLGSWLRGGKDIGWTLQVLIDYPSHLAFERAVWQRFKTDLRQGRFDLVHRFTPMTPPIPSYMASKCPIPLVLGPLNGGLPWPRQFTQELKRERESLTYLREAYRLFPYYRATYKRPQTILAAHAHTIKDLPAGSRAKVINFPDTGYDPNLFPMVDRQPGGPMTILFAGRLVPYKQPAVVLQAIAHSPLLQQHRLVVIGDGPERPRLEQIIQDYKLEHCVELLRSVPYADFARVMQQADIFAFPSIRELGGNVILEAMAVGLTCVVVDYGGPGTFIDADRGVKIPMGDVHHLIQAYQRTLEDLVSHPDKVAHLGRAAHDHVLRYYSWQARSRKMLEIYHWTLGRSDTKPDYWQQPALGPQS